VIAHAQYTGSIKIVSGISPSVTITDVILNTACRPSIPKLHRSNTA
jgi:hypothetical protein